MSGYSFWSGPRRQGQAAAYRSSSEMPTSSPSATASWFGSRSTATETRLSTRPAWGSSQRYRFGRRALAGRVAGGLPLAADAGEELLRIRHGSEVAKLLRVDDRADRLDPAVRDVERQDVDEPAIRAQELRARLPVHRDTANLEPADALREPAPVTEHLGRLGAAEDRMPDRWRDPAAVAVELDILGQQRLERLEIPVLHRREEARCEFVAPLLGRVEPRPPVIDLSPRPGGQLSRVVLTGPDDLGHPAVLVVEDVVQEEGGPLLRGERLEHHQEGERE